MSQACVFGGTMVKDYDEYLDFDEEPQSRTEHEKTSAFGYQHHGFFRAEIPIMPLSLAVLCCFLNMLIPGLGTFWAALSVLCCSDSGRSSTFRCFMVNLLAAMLQFLLFPILVGFLWSVIWGIMFIQIARNWFISDLHHRADFLSWCPCSNW